MSTTEANTIDVDSLADWWRHERSDALGNRLPKILFLPKIPISGDVNSLKILLAQYSVPAASEMN